MSCCELSNRPTHSPSPDFKDMQVARGDAGGPHLPEPVQTDYRIAAMQSHRPQTYRLTTSTNCESQ